MTGMTDSKAVEVLAEIRRSLPSAFHYAEKRNALDIAISRLREPAGVGGFTAADMMDARKEASEFAQQPAAVDGAMKNLRDAILRNDGLTRKNTLAAFRAVEDALAALHRTAAQEAGND